MYLSVISRKRNRGDGRDRHDATKALRCDLFSSYRIVRVIAAAAAESSVGTKVNYYLTNDHHIYVVPVR
jgi:hypothetical protein